MTTPPARLAAALAAHYRLERELGAGGMATVYLAHDLKHDRRVAVKVLRPELAAVIGAERFLAEIKTTANLQHPHILGLLDSGDADGFLYYVMPYVEGESLRDRLNHEKQLPVDVATRIAGEVASALDYAHRHNVIHRDIKPENILLHDGSALVADFGIALAAHKAGGTRMTETGMSLGTPHYMSPEQAMGEREITARSDVYALGCVLYEMLVGEPPFTGPTAQAIVAKVMTDDPRPLHTLRRTVPPAIEDAVLTALEKLPADRFATAAEFAAALAGGGPSRTTTRVHAARHAPSRVPVLLTVALIFAAALAAWGWLRPAPPAPPPSRLAIMAPGLGGSGGASLARQVALSPDGGTVFFLAVGADGQEPGTAPATRRRGGHPARGHRRDLQPARSRPTGAGSSVREEKSRRSGSRSKEALPFRFLRASGVPGLRTGARTATSGSVVRWPRGDSPWCGLAVAIQSRPPSRR